MYVYVSEGRVQAGRQGGREAGKEGGRQGGAPRVMGRKHNQLAVAPASSQAHLERWCRWLRCAGAFIRVLIVQLACAIMGGEGE